MMKKGYLYHTSDSYLRYELRNYTWSVAGENVGRGGSMKAIFDAFMASQTHRDNILYRGFRSVGVGVVWNGATGYVTLTFMG